MAHEDLQAFRRHPPMWPAEGEQPAAEARHRTSPPPRAPPISWPLTSFANTIQNVCSISALLGAAIALNLAALLLPGSPCPPLHLYAALLAAFHLLEFLATAIFNPARVTVDSFLLNNGGSYWAAHAFSVCEYTLRATTTWLDGWMAGGILETRGVRMAGLGLAAAGQLVRTAAMATAARSFSHRLATSPAPDHALVTSGIYKCLRHPSYFGFFWWTLGIQLFLANPISLLLFALVLWSFFNARIQTEESHLVKFFGQAYVDYRASTPTLIPFIK